MEYRSENGKLVFAQCCCSTGNHNFLIMFLYFHLLIVICYFISYIFITCHYYYISWSYPYLQRWNWHWQHTEKLWDHRGVYSALLTVHICRGRVSSQCFLHWWCCALSSTNHHGNQCPSVISLCHCKYCVILWLF